MSRKYLCCDPLSFSLQIICTLSYPYDHRFFPSKYIRKVPYSDVYNEYVAAHKDA